MEKYLYLPGEKSIIKSKQKLFAKFSLFYGGYVLFVLIVSIFLGNYYRIRIRQTTSRIIFISEFIILILYTYYVFYNKIYGAKSILILFSIGAYCLGTWFTVILKKSKWHNILGSH
jgi:hypothetical protein